jgi:hydroxymethylbilane synthase
MTDATTVRIGTRGSDLALRQSEMVQSLLGARGATAELITIKTTGDKKLDEPLSTIGAKGLFTRELEVALRKGKVDCCVHSLKDLPTESVEGLEIAAVLERADPRDVLVVNHVVEASSLEDLPRGSRVGTSSVRRRAQLMAARPDIEVVELRGNVPTRLRKVDEGRVHAAVLAAAGLERLRVHQRITQYLDPPFWLPAAGQGAVAVQIRSDDTRMRALVAALNHAPTMIATRAERAFLAALEGGCQVPIGALVVEIPSEDRREAPRLRLYGLIATLDGTEIVRGERDVDPADPELAGVRLANDLRPRRATEILATLRSVDKLPAPQPQ